MGGKVEQCCTTRKRKIFFVNIHLSDEFLLDDLEELVLLEILARDVQGKVIRVNDSADE